MPAPALLTVDNYFPIPEGAKYYTRRDDDIAHNIEDAQSFSFFNRVISTGRNYRDNADAAFMGDSLLQFSQQLVGSRIAVPGAPTAFQVADPVVGSLSLVNGNPIVISLPDEISHKAPRNESITVTYRIFWDGDDGTGKVVAMLPEYLFGQFSKEIPVRY